MNWLKNYERIIAIEQQLVWQPVTEIDPRAYIPEVDSLPYTDWSVSFKPFDAHCCHMGTAIKHPVTDRVKPSFVIFDIRALWRSRLSVRVPRCQKLQMTAQPWLSKSTRLNPVWHEMLYSCTHMATGVKGSTSDVSHDSRDLRPSMKLQDHTQSLGSLDGNNGPTKEQNTL